MVNVRDANHLVPALTRAMYAAASSLVDSARPHGFELRADAQASVAAGLAVGLAAVDGRLTER